MAAAQVEQLEAEIAEVEAEVVGEGQPRRLHLEAGLGETARDAVEMVPLMPGGAGLVASRVERGEPGRRKVGLSAHVRGPTFEVGGIGLHFLERVVVADHQRLGKGRVAPAVAPVAVCVDDVGEAVAAELAGRRFTDQAPHHRRVAGVHQDQAGGADDHDVVALPG